MARESKWMLAWCAAIGLIAALALAVLVVEDVHAL